MSENILLNRWKKLKYHDPEKVLIEFRKVEYYISNKNIDEKLRTLRTNKLKHHREGREAAIFCHGLSKSVINTKVRFALYESADYDFIARWVDGDTLVYTPVQLKEIVPKGINPAACLNDEINKLTKYKDSKCLVVAIHLNQTGRFNFEELYIPKLEIAELWIYGALKQDQSEWFLYGNALMTTNFHSFFYP